MTHEYKKFYNCFTGLLLSRTDRTAVASISSLGQMCSNQKTVRFFLVCSDITVRIPTHQRLSVKNVAFPELEFLKNEACVSQNFNAQL